MATLGNAVTSVFDVITSTSTTVVSTVNAIATGAGMLNDFVGAQRTMQNERLIAHSISYSDILLEEVSADAFKREEKIRQLVGNDPAKQASYQAHYDRLKLAIAAASKPKDDA